MHMHVDMQNNHLFTLRRYFHANIKLEPLHIYN